MAYFILGMPLPNILIMQNCSQVLNTYGEIFREVSESLFGELRRECI